MSSGDKAALDPEFHDTDGVIDRNVRRAREVIEGRKHSENEGQAHRPTKADPNAPDEAALPNQWDLPAGGHSGPNVGGGSSKRHKP